MGKDADRSVGGRIGRLWGVILLNAFVMPNDAGSISESAREMFRGDNRLVLKASMAGASATCLHTQAPKGGLR